MDKRKDKRFFKKLMVKIVSQGKNSWGAVQDISQNGLFIQTNKAFNEGLKIDIELIMPNNEISLLKGIVQRSITTKEAIRKFAIGVELLSKDTLFNNLLNTLSEQSTTPRGVSFS